MMWDKLPYKQKFRLLGVAGFLLLIICYKFSIAKTIEEYNSYKENTISSNALSNETMPGESLDEKEKKLNNTLDQYILDTLDNSKNLLGIVGNYCNNHDLVLKEYKPIAESQPDTMKILTRYFSVEGKFIDCLKLLYALETKYKAGKVSSALFKSYTDQSGANTFLNCTVYVQNLISNFYDKK